MDADGYTFQTTIFPPQNPRLERAFTPTAVLLYWSARLSLRLWHAWLDGFFRSTTSIKFQDGAYGWLSSRALAPDGSDQPMNRQRRTPYTDLPGYDGTGSAAGV